MFSSDRDGIQPGENKRVGIAVYRGGPNDTLLGWEVSSRFPARPACPLALILYATFTPFVFGILGWLAYLLR